MLLSSLSPSLRRVDLPPSPYQWRIRDTSLSLIFDKYAGSIAWVRLVSILFRAQTEVVQGVINNKGDGTILTPNMIWRQGRQYVTVNQHLELPWSNLSNVLMGIYDFYGVYEPTLCSVTILDDKEGILGEVIIGSGY